MEHESAKGTKNTKKTFLIKMVVLSCSSKRDKTKDEIY